MKVGFENLRVFKEFTEFDLRPITVLTGPNNSGKSAVGKLLYLIKNGLKKDAKGPIDLLKLHFDEELIKNIGDFESNKNRSSAKEFISFQINSDHYMKVNFGINKEDNQYKYSLSYSDPEPGKDFCLLKSLQVFSEERIIIDLSIINYNQIVKKYPEKIREWYEGQNEDYKMSHSYEDYLNHNVKDHVYLRFNNSTTIISNILYFLSNEFDSKDKMDYVDENFVKLPGFDKMSIRKELSNLALKYDQNANGITYKSYFLDLVLKDELFFTKSFTGKESDYKRFIKYTLESENINTHKDFLKSYREFEISLVSFYLKGHLKNGTISFNQGLSDFFKKSEFGKKEINIEDINNPLTKLFMLEQQAGKWFNDSNFEIDGDLALIVESLPKESRSDLFGDDTNLAGNMFFSNELKWTNLELLNTVWYKQNEIVSGYYLENDPHNVNTSFFRFGYNYHLGKIQEGSLNFVNQWISKLGLGDCLLIEPIKVKDRIIGSSFALKDGDRIYPLLDNGYGINKLIQILLELALFTIKPANNNWEESARTSILVIEEPESNLHPSFQSILAEIFAEATQLFEVKILVESHSEYLIRKLQNLIASQDNPLKNEDVSIYYLHNPKNIPQGENQVYQLDIREDGFMNNDFGKGFFDESASLSLGLLNLKSFN